MTTTYQKNRKNLLHVRAFTTISTKNIAPSQIRRPTIFRPRQKDGSSESVGFVSRGLTFQPRKEQSRNIGEETDAECVKAVPLNFVSISKPSKAVERLMTKRNNSHENAREEMRKELSTIHEKCENELRDRSEQMKIDIDRIKNKVEEHQRKINETDLSTLNGKNFQLIWDAITSLLTEEKNVIDQFYNNLCNIERARQSRVKEVMKKYYEIFHQIAYISPFEIQVFLENEIQDYNETILQNFKVYEDLRLRLLTVSDSRCKELQYWLEDVNDKRRDEICLENIRRLIRKKETLSKPEEMFVYNPDGQTARFELSSKLELFEETIKKWQTDIVIFEESSVNECSKELSECVTELKNCFGTLVVSYKLGLQKLFEKYENEVVKVKQDKNCVLDNDVKLLNGAVDSLKDCYKIVSNNFQELCNHRMKAIETTAEEFSHFLRDFNIAWKKQASRLLDLQDNVGRLVDDLITKSQKSIGELEKKINNYSQQIRQATFEEKMKQQIPLVYKTLDLISEKHKFTYEDECKAVKKYIETVFNEVPNVIKEFTDILELYGYKNNDSAEEQDREIDFSQDQPNFMSQQFKLCESIVTTILYWKSSLMDEIVEFRENFPKIIEDAAQPWQEIILSERSAVLQSKLDQNIERREQVLSHIYGVRVQEIEQHKQRLENHETEVNQILEATSNRVEEFLRDHKQFMQICDENIVTASEQLAAAKSMTELNRLQKEVQTTRKNYKNEIEKKVETHREELRNTFELLMNKNDRFLQEIQLFKDGGNFSVDEVKSYKKTLTSLGKTISNLQSANLERLNRVIGELDVTLETLVKNALENFNTKLKELTFVEDTKKAMTKCAVIIERQVARLLEDNTIFIDAVLNSVEKSPTPLCETTTIKMIEILDLMDSRLDHLIIPFTMPKNIAMQEPIKWSRKRSIANKKRKEKGSSKTINYVSLFMGSEDSTAHGNGFSVTAMNTMVKTIEKIQADASKYFSGSSKRNETETTYQDHMKEILEKMNSYRVQLENLWRQEVRDLVAASAILDNSIHACIRKSLDDFYDKQIKEIKGTIKKKIGTLDEAMRVWLTRRDDILGTFKVSHGHPATRESLNKLRDEILEEEQQMQDTIIEKFTEFKSDLEEHANGYEISLLEMATPLKKILNKVDNRTKRQRLNDLLDERKTSKLPVFTESSDRLDIPKNSRRNSLKLKRKWSKAASSIDMESVLSDLVEKAKHRFNSALAEAETSVKSFVKAGEEFQQSWRANMEIVAEIYEIPQ